MTAAEVQEFVLAKLSMAISKQRFEFAAVVTIALSSISCEMAGPSGGSPARYESDVNVLINGDSVRFVGVGECYNGGTVFTLDLSGYSPDHLGFITPFQVGTHAVDGDATRIDVRAGDVSTRAFSGSVTVSHLDEQKGADGEISARGSPGSLSGHWGCRFEG
jgi:hypothetical protein